MLRLRVIAVVLAVAGSVCAGGAGAQVIATVGQPGPVTLVGGGVLVQHGESEIDSVTAGGVVSRLVQGPGPGHANFGSGTSNSLTFAASSQQLAYEVGSDSFYKADDCFDGCSWSLSSGPPHGPFAAVANCEATSMGPPFAVSGPLLAYGVSDCALGTAYLAGTALPANQVLVRDTSGTAADMTIALPSGLGLSAIAISGNVLAAGVLPAGLLGAAPDQQAAVMTWNATTGTQLSDQPLPGISDVTGVAVQDDGAVAFTGAAYGPADCETLGTIAPSGPLRTIPGCSMESSIAVHGGDVTFIANGELQTTDLNGTRLGNALDLSGVPIHFDTDGTQLVLSLPTCDGHGVVQSTSLLAPNPSKLRATCPARLLSARARHDRTIAYRIRCPLGCRAYAQVRQTKDRAYETTATRIRPGRAKTISINPKRTSALRPGHATAEVLTRDLTGRFRVVAERRINIPTQRGR